MSSILPPIPMLITVAPRALLHDFVNGEEVTDRTPLPAPVRAWIRRTRAAADCDTAAILTTNGRPSMVSRPIGTREFHPILG